MTIQTDINAIDATKPVNASPTEKPTLKSVRDNFAAIKAVLQGFQDSFQGAFGFVFNGGGDVITTGRHGNIVITVPYRCLVTSWTMTGGATGSAVVDIIKGSYASYPFTTPSIAGGEKPSISGSPKNQHTLTTPWQLEAGDMLIADVQSCVSFAALTLSFTVTRN